MVAKPSSLNGRGNSGLTRPTQGMRLELEPSFAMTYELEQGLDIALKDFAQARSLVLKGEFPVYQVRATRGSLGAGDQVALVDSLLNRPGVAAMTLMWSSTPAGSKGGESAETKVRFSTSDFGLIGLTLLHRAQRISPARYLEVLADFETSNGAGPVPGNHPWLSVPIIGAVH